MALHRRTLLTGIAGGLVAAGAAPAFALDSRRVLHVRPGDSVQAAVDAVEGSGWTVVVHPGTYREVVNIPADKGELTLRGATRDPRDVVIVYDNGKEFARVVGNVSAAQLDSKLQGNTP